MIRVQQEWENEMSSRSTERMEEIHLFPLLETQFPWLAKSYRENLAFLSAKAANHPNLLWYNDDSGRLFFRVDLNLPALFILSEPLSRFRAYKQYILPIDEERRFYANLGIIPVYFANLNRISCIKFWGSQASDFFAPYSQPLRRDEDVVWRLDPAPSSPAQFSSMNFILRQGATENEVSPSVRAALSDYFKYAFWSFPRLGFACSAHIIHSRENINHILKVAKSVYLIKEIHESRNERLAPYYWARVQRVELEVVTQHGGPKTFWAYLAKDVVEKICAETKTGSAHNLLINGLVYEFKDKVQRPSDGLRLLSVVADFLPTDLELFKTLTALSAVERFRRNTETLGPIGLISELRADIEMRYRPFIRRTEYSTSLFSMLGGPIEYILNELFPIVVSDGEQVFFVHPAILGGLIELGMTDALEAKDVLTLVSFIRLLEKMRAGKSSPMNLRLSDEGEYFRKRGVSFPDLLQVLLSVFWWIRLSKLLCEFF